jgi:hypothetical protein
VIHQSFKSLFTDSSHVKFGLPLPLFSLSVRFITPLQIGASAGLRWICPNHLKRCCMSFSSTGASAGLRWICPNHLKRCCMSFSSTGATPSILRVSSFRTRSLLVWPQIHRSMRISATLNCWTCHLLVDKHSAPYNIASRIVVL